MTNKEDYAIILDFLPYGYPLEKKMMPVAQAIGKKNLTLLELVPRRGIKLEAGEEVYIGEGKREKVYYILGKLEENKLTNNAKKLMKNISDKHYLDKSPMEIIKTLTNEKPLDSSEFGLPQDIILFDFLKPHKCEEIERKLKLFFPNKNFRIRTQIGMKRSQGIMHGRYFQH